MGKNGKALREAKAQRVTYTFTREQLEEHDRQVKEAYKKQADRRMQQIWHDYDVKQRKDFDEHVNTLWEQRRKEFNSGVKDDDMHTLLSYLLAISARVLIERFGWTPIEGHRYTRRNRIVRFCEGVIEELDMIRSDEKMDAIQYSNETYRKYGVKFAMQEDNDDEAGNS